MKRLLLVLVTVSALGGCGDDAPDAASLAVPPEGPAPVSAPELLPLDATATVPYDDGLLEISITRIEDPVATPKDIDDGFTSRASKTGRYLALHVKVTNKGPGAYNDDLYGADQMLDGDGNVIEGAQLIGWGDCDGALNTTIAPGGTRSSCGNFEVPKGVVPSRYVVLNSGAQVAGWTLNDEAPPTAGG